MANASFNVARVHFEYQHTSASIHEVAERYGLKYHTLRSYAYRHRWKKHKRIIKYFDKHYHPEYYSELSEQSLTFAILVSYSILIGCLIMLIIMLIIMRMAVRKKRPG